MHRWIIKWFNYIKVQYYKYMPHVCKTENERKGGVACQWILFTKACRIAKSTLLRNICRKQSKLGNSFINVTSSTCKYGRFRKWHHFESLDDWVKPSPFSISHCIAQRKLNITSKNLREDMNAGRGCFWNVNEMNSFVRQYPKGLLPHRSPETTLKSLL